MSLAPTSRSKTVITDRKYVCVCAWVHSLSGLCGRYSTFFGGGGGLVF